VPLPILLLYYLWDTPSYAHPQHTIRLPSLLPLTRILTYCPLFALILSTALRQPAFHPLPFGGQHSLPAARAARTLFGHCLGCHTRARATWLSILRGLSAADCCARYQRSSPACGLHTPSRDCDGVHTRARFALARYTLYRRRNDGRGHLRRRIAPHHFTSDSLYLNVPPVQPYAYGTDGHSTARLTYHGTLPRLYCLVPAVLVPPAITISFWRYSATHNTTTGMHLDICTRPPHTVRTPGALLAHDHRRQRCAATGCCRSALSPHAVRAAFCALPATLPFR